MKKKISVGVTFGLIFLSIALTAIATALIVQQKTNALLGDLPEKQARYEVLDELDSLIAAHYYGKNDSKALRRAIESGYVSGLSDGVSRLLSAEEFKQFQAVSRGQMQGVGFTFSKTEKGVLRVESVTKGSPAAKGGIKKGDSIVAVDAIVLDPSNCDEIAQKLENNNVMSVSVTFRRKEQETTVELEKGYEAASVFTDTYQNIGYLQITQFYDSTASQVQSAVELLQSSGVRALVVDVRENASMNVENAIKTLDVFVPLNQDTPAATLVDKAGETISTLSTSAGEVNLPMAVLVSKKTAYAGELFACDLRDFGKAQLVGTTTAGKALVTDSFRLSDGDHVLLSVGEMLPYQSESFQENGLKPDVAADESESTETLSKDSQFLAAAALFTE
ncbi:MAG: PDZ domain-containing protein [Clostridia bacterium]|nr:PDZ domain-containing protein [Clostridia bacterium]